MAGEPWTATKDYLYSGGQFLRLCTDLTVSDALVISALGSTKLDLLATVSEPTPTYAGALNTEVKYFETKLSTGNTLRVEDKTNTIEANTGYKATGDGKAVDAFEATVLVGMSDYTALLGLYRNGKSIFAIRGMGFAAYPGDGLMDGFEHLLGKITEFAPTEKDGLKEVKIKISGGKTHTATGTATYSDYSTKLTGASNTITPVGMSEQTIKAITTDDFTSLLTGKIVQTAGA